MSRDANIHIRQPLFQHRFQPRGIGFAFRTGERGRAGADDRDVELLLFLYRPADAGEFAFTEQQIAGHVAGIRALRCRAARQQTRNEERSSQRLHASPPARSASVVFVRGPVFRPSIPLYHDKRPAAPIINPTPMILTATCIGTPPEISPMAKWAA